MDVKELKALRRRLDVFLSRFRDCVKTAPSRRHLRTYVAGQVGDLERKNAAAIALEAGVRPRLLQEFLEINRWDEEAVAKRVQTIVATEHAAPKTIGVIDETGSAKKGHKTVGVERQYCGATGKVEGCVVTVHLGYVAGDFRTLVGSDVYVPEAWLADRERCREAGIPDELAYRPKWRIAVDLVGEAVENGVPLKYLTADEEYGRCGAFREELDALGVVYVVEVPRNLTGWTRRPRTLTARARRVDRLWKRGGPSWKAFHVKNTHKGPVVWEARATRFFPWRKGNVAGEELWLIVARNVLTGEVKYFLSNAPADTPLEVLLHIAFSRDHIEKLFQQSKGEVGLDHFEVRRYRAVKRHLVLTMVSLLFLAEETERLREKKSVVEPMPSSSSHRSATGP